MENFLGQFSFLKAAFVVSFWLIFIWDIAECCVFFFLSQIFPYPSHATWSHTFGVKHIASEDDRKEPFTVTQSWGDVEILMVYCAKMHPPWRATSLTQWFP